MVETKFLLLAIFLAVLTCGHARASGKIRKVEGASILDFPYQVSLQTLDGKHFCGGTIILPKYILTAAHCIVDQHLNSAQGGIIVVAGTFDRLYRTPENVYYVTRRFRHTNFNPFTSNENDIALLKLDRQIPLSNFESLAMLSSHDPPENASVTVTGWGATTYDEPSKEPQNLARYLQKLESTVLEQRQCQELMGEKKIYPNQICVRSEGESDSCAGDIGGPLTYNGKVIGIRSSGMGCGTRYPDIYTRIHYYFPWMSRIVIFANRGANFVTDTSDFREVIPID